MTQLLPLFTFTTALGVASWHSRFNGEAEALAPGWRGRGAFLLALLTLGLACSLL